VTTTTFASATSFIQGLGPIAVDSGVRVSDSNATLIGATVAITSGFAGAQDVLGLNAAALPN